ncbi:MAG: leucine-rich repeat domain-containing protein [Bacteroidales bacterium]|nr:leucine-rich repeat domain-containing protein [Bacteroidales bacterium]MBR6161522.1 leucine-rich repeat domain-containing protein [Bacteroidales bacterium]
MLSRNIQKIIPINMKHIFLSFFTFAALLFAILPCQAQTFSAVTPSGHTLVYQILNGKAQVTRLNSNDSGCIVTGFLIIPDTVTYNGHSYLVTAIGNEAFRGCSLLSGFSIPNSVTSIGNEAFKNCSSLTNITIPNSVTSIETKLLELVIL